MYYCFTRCLYGADSTISIPSTITAVHGSIGLYPGRTNRSTWVSIERFKLSRMKRGIAVMDPDRVQKLQHLGFELLWYYSKLKPKEPTAGKRPRDGCSNQVLTYEYCRSVILIVVLQTLLIVVQADGSRVFQHTV
jgi:hypothetical protein